MLSKIFPFSTRSKTVEGLIISIVIYIVCGAVAGLVIGLLAKIPIIGVIFGLIGGIVDLYCLCGIIISVLIYCKVVS